VAELPPIRSAAGEPAPQPCAPGSPRVIVAGAQLVGEVVGELVADHQS